ncbi:MAG: arginase [Sphingobacteriales bacterium]|nr:MAG: arginase [Sphingobacteriales bacterium]
MPQMDGFNLITRAEIDSYIYKRPGETKLGETVSVLDGSDWQFELRESSAQFVLIGIPEDIGVRANFGLGGAQHLWKPVLKSLLNVQETEILQGSKLAVLGAFGFEQLMHEAEGASVEKLRELVSRVDDLVYPVIQSISACGKIPLVIGGGHNNAYPIIKGLSRSIKQQINCLNLDAHSDYRAIEGRHSGNGFRYAKMDGYLNKYAVIGLHQSYNSQSVLNELASDKDIRYSFYEDLFLSGQLEFQSAIDDALRFASGARTGIEIDLDCIENALSSAASPCGITPLQARKFIISCARFAEVAYLHITEGTVKLADGRENVLTAKLVAYIITDFIRSATNKLPVFIKESEL